MNFLHAALAASVLALAACGSDTAAESPASASGSTNVAASVKDAAPATTAASPNGTTIPAATQIIDGDGNVWTVAGGVVFENGASSGVSGNVTLLLYDNDTLYAENTGGTWYSWNGSAWIAGSDPRATPSPNGTTVVAANLTGTDIVSLSSGQCVTVSGDSSTAGTAIVQWTCGSVSGQLWSLTSVGSYYHVVSAESGLCLNITGSSTAQGDPIIEWPCQTNGATNDQWSIVAVSGYYEIVSAFDGQCLNVDGNSQAAGAALIQWPCASFEPSNYNDVWSLVSPASQGQITDSSGNVWTIANGVAFENGVASDSVIATLLLYDNNTLYQEDSAGTWSSWNGSAWISGSDPRATPSPNGTSVPTATQITDSSGNVWAIVGGVIYENGTLAGYSANVTELLYDNGSIYQENSAGSWWSWNGSTWVSSSDPEETGSATLSWTAPTENTDGTPLTDLSGYTIYYGSSASALTNTVQVTDPSTTSGVVSNLSAGTTYYFAVAANASDGTQSALSSVASEAIP
jgi:hypothetical protein